MSIMPGVPMIGPLAPGTEMLSNTVQQAGADQLQQNRIDAGLPAEVPPQSVAGSPTAGAAGVPQSPEEAGQAAAAGYTGAGTDESVNFETRMMTPGYMGAQQNVYYTLDQDGNYVRVEIPADKRVAPDFEQEAVTRLSSLTPPEQAQWKQMLYWSGFYDKGYVPRWDALGLITPEDKVAMAKALYLHNDNPAKSFDSFVGSMSAAGYAEQTPYLQGGTGPTSLVDQAEARKVYSSTEQNIRTFMLNNGVDVTDKFIKDNATNIASGVTTIDEWKDKIREEYIINAYPALADRVKSGQDLATIASPYIQSYASAMGLDPSQVDLSNPTIRKALQSTNKDGVPTTMPLWKFNESLYESDDFKKTTKYQSGMADFASTFRSMMGM